MTVAEMWNQFITEKNISDTEYETWAFGDAPDVLAELVLEGIKTGTSSAYPLYELAKESLPQVDEYSVILDSEGNAVCIIRTINVEILPFKEVEQKHAYKEGEGDKSLAYWRLVHSTFFEKCMKEEGLVFDENMLVVFEEFELVYDGKEV